MLYKNTMQEQEIMQLASAAYDDYIKQENLDFPIPYLNRSHRKLFSTGLLSNLYKETIGEIFPGKLFNCDLGFGQSAPQPVTFASTLLFYSYKTCLINNTLNRENFIMQAREDFLATQNLLREETIQAPLIMVVGGLEILPEQIIKIKIGELHAIIRKPIAHEVEQFSDKKHNFFPTAILATKINFKIKKIDTESYQINIAEQVQTIISFISSIPSLALEKPFPILPISIEILHMLFPQKISWLNPATFYFPQVLTQNEAYKIEKISTLINPPQRFELVLRRLMLAMNRTVHEDALIDLVICWESLVGSNGKNINDKIATAISVLLSEDVQDQKILKKELKKYYGVRSKIVHGIIRSKPKEELGKIVTSCYQITISAINKIFSRPELIDIKPNTRAEMLISSSIQPSSFNLLKWVKKILQAWLK